MFGPEFDDDYEMDEDETDFLKLLLGNIDFGALDEPKVFDREEELAERVAEINTLIPLMELGYMLSDDHSHDVQCAQTIATCAGIRHYIDGDTPTVESVRDYILDVFPKEFFSDRYMNGIVRAVVEDYSGFVAWYEEYLKTQE